VSNVARPVAWAFAIWGTVLYVLSGALYAAQLIQVVRADRAAAGPAPVGGAAAAG